MLNGRLTNLLIGVSHMPIGVSHIKEPHFSRMDISVGDPEVRFALSQRGVKVSSWLCVLMVRNVGMGIR